MPGRVAIDQHLITGGQAQIRAREIRYLHVQLLEGGCVDSRVSPRVNGFLHYGVPEFGGTIVLGVGRYTQSLTLDATRPSKILTGILTR